MAPTKIKLAKEIDEVRPEVAWWLHVLKRWFNARRKEAKAISECFIFRSSTGAVG